MKPIRWGTALAVTCLLVAPAAPQGQEQQWPPPESQSGDIEPQSINCGGATYATGAGASLFNLCVSDHGNMVSLQYPAGFEHINIPNVFEGYGVCATNPIGGQFYYYDMAAFENGFGAPVVLDPAPFPITIRRTSLDGRIILDQKFLPSKIGRAMTVTMTVTNPTATTLTGVQVSRVIDADMDNTPTGDVFDRSTDQTWARETRSLVLAAPTIATPHTTAVHSGVGSGPCSSPGVATPVTGDFQMRIWYDLGSIGPGKKKAVVFRYNGA